LASFHLNEIEFEDECDTDSQSCDSVSFFESILTLVSSPDLDPIPEPTLIPVPIDFEYEPFILDSHIPLLENECERQFFDLDQTLELNLTLEPKLDLSQLYESVLVSIPFTFESKSTIPQNHIPLLK